MIRVPSSLWTVRVQLWECVRCACTVDERYLEFVLVEIVEFELCVGAGGCGGYTCTGGERRNAGRLGVLTSSKPWNLMMKSMIPRSIDLI